MDFDDAWPRAGYSRRDSAKRRLTQDLIEGEDYTIVSLHNLVGSDNHADLKPQESATLIRTEIIKLSPDGVEHLMMMAQTKEGRSARKMYIQYKRAYLAGLEYQPTEPLAPFPHTLTKLHQISGIVSRSQVRKAVTRDYHLGTEYIKIGRELFLTEDTFNWLVTHFESERGTDIEQLPETIPLKRKGFKRKASHKNARISSEWEQLELPI